MELDDVSALFAGGEFQAFAQLVADGGAVKALRSVPGAGGMSRKELDDLTAEAKQAGAKGLVWIKVNPDGLQSPVAEVHPGDPAAAADCARRGSRATCCCSSEMLRRWRRRCSGACEWTWRGGST